MGIIKNSSKHLFTLNVEGLKLLCELDSNRKPIVIHGNHVFKSLFAVVHAVPSLNHSDNLEALSCLVNHFAKGNTFLLIPHIKTYQEKYQQSVEFEKNTLDYLPSRISDHGIFDVSKMHTPRLLNNELTFFVEDKETHLPYQVFCPFPITETSQVRYQFLPYAN